MPLANIIIQDNAGKDPSASGPGVLDAYILLSTNSLAFYYLHGSGNAIANKSFTAELFDEPSACGALTMETSIAYASGSGWLSEDDHTISGDIHTFEFAADAGTMMPGIYYAIVTITAKCDGDVVAISDDINVFFQITEGNILDAIPDFISFSHIKGSTLPDVVAVAVEASTAWTAVEQHDIPLLTIAPASAPGDLSIDIGLAVAVDTMDADFYTRTILLSDNATENPVEKQIEIEINISEVTELTIIPESISLEYLRGSDTIPYQVIQVLTTAAWTAIAPSRLHLSAESVTLTVVNASTMLAGEYNYELEFTSGTDVVVVPVQLKVFDFLESPFQIEGLYFTHDDNLLRINSNKENTYVDINITARANSYAGEMLTFVKNFKLPLLHKEATFCPGTILYQLFFSDENINAVLEYYEYYTGQFQPLNVDIEIIEKDISTDEIYYNAAIYNLDFVKGATPLAFPVLMNNNDFSRLPNFNTIFLPFLGKGDLSAAVTVNEVVTDYTLSDTDLFLYNFNLKLDSALEVGTEVDVHIVNDQGDVHKKYLKFPKGIDVSLLYFKNSHGVFQEIEFTGKRSTRAALVQKTNLTTENIEEREIVVEVSEKEYLKINTGWILPAEVATINDLLKSEKIYLKLTDESYLELRAITKKITLSETYNKLYNFNIEFQTMSEHQVYIAGSGSGTENPA